MTLDEKLDEKEEPSKKPDFLRPFDDGPNWKRAIENQGPNIDRMYGQGFNSARQGEYLGERPAVPEEKRPYLKKSK